VSSFGPGILPPADRAFGELGIGRLEEHARELETHG
jgi:hypothetical protein